jgi:hypothetical protein
MNNKEDASSNQTGSRWFIDLDWFQRSNRSFSALAQGCLCPKCRERWLKGELPAADLLASIRDCCSKAPDFITGDLPVLESVFRFFLASGNQPLVLNELSRELSEQHGRDAYRTSAEVLSRLLSSDYYYGLRQINEQSAEDSV